MEESINGEVANTLGDGWALYYTEEGWPYYYHAESGESQWTEQPYYEDPDVEGLGATPQYDAIEGIAQHTQADYSLNYGNTPNDTSIANHSVSQNSSMNMMASNMSSMSVTGGGARILGDEHADDMEEMFIFFKQACSLSHLAARISATNCIARNLSTPKKLAKIWNRNNVNLNNDLELDEDDAEDVALALRAILQQPHPATSSSLNNSSMSIQTHQLTNTDRYDNRNSNLWQQQQQYPNVMTNSMASVQTQNYISGNQHHQQIPNYNHNNNMDDNLEFFETESVHSHSTRNSRNSRSQQKQRNPSQLQSSTGGPDLSMWIECLTTEGQKYYYNDKTQMVQWESPFGSQQQPVRQSQPQLQPNQQHLHQQQSQYLNQNNYKANRTAPIVPINSYQDPYIVQPGLYNTTMPVHEEEEENDGASVSDLSSGSESRQRRSKSYAKASKLTNRKKAERSMRINAKGGSKLPAQYSDTMARALTYSNDDASSRASGSVSRTSRNGKMINKSQIQQDIPAMAPRSLEVWSRFFENALKAKDGTLGNGEEDELKSWSLPVLSVGKWPEIMEEEEFATMIDAITSQPPSLTRDKNLNTALVYAILGSDLPVVERLLQLGADPNFIDSQLRSPLHYASRIGSTPIVAIISDHGADPEKSDVNGNTPLHIACTSGATDVVTYLVESAVYVDSMNKEGNTPLHLTTHGGAEAIECCLVLLEYEALPLIVNYSGQNALQYARHHHSMNNRSGLGSLLNELERLYTELGVDVNNMTKPAPGRISDVPPILESNNGESLNNSMGSMSLQSNNYPPAVNMSQQRDSTLPAPPRLRGRLDQNNNNVSKNNPSSMGIAESPPSSPNRNKPIWVNKLTVDLGGYPADAHPPMPPPTGLESNGDTREGSRGQKPSPTFQSPSHTPNKSRSNGNGPHNAKYSPGGSQIDDDWVRDVENRLKAASPGRSIGSGIVSSSPNGGSLVRKTSFLDETPIQKNNTVPDSNIHTTIPTTEPTAGESVVDAVWSTANSLLGVTMAMLGGDETKFDESRKN
jgi:hypothetical protein